MRKNRTTKLNLLSLENRVTPNATVSFLNGNLTVTMDSTATSVFVTNSDNNSVGAVPGQGFRVFVVQGNQTAAFSGAGGDPAQFETAANLRFFTNNFTGKLTVNGGNSADLFVLTLEDGTSLPGALASSMGNSADDIQLQVRTASNINATIPGTVTLNGGLGADNFFIFDMDIQGILSVTGGGSGFRPVSNLPGDVIDMSDSNVNALMTVNNCVTLIDSGFGPNTIDQLVVNNNVASPLGNFQTIMAEVFPPTALPGDPGTYSGLLVLDTGSTVTGNLTYGGSGSNDGVYIRGIVNGNLAIPAQAGNNDFYLGDRGNPGTVNGNVSYVGVAGVDRVVFDTNSSVVSGGVSLYMGDGNNLYDLSNPFSVNGGFTLYAGNGTDNIGSVAGFVGGNQSYSPGNGANTLTWDGSAGSARFDYNGGGGTDIVTMNGVNAFNLYVYLNGGDDQLGFGDNSAFGTVTADGGGGNDGLHMGAFMTFTSFSAANFEYGY